VIQNPKQWWREKAPAWLRHQDVTIGVGQETKYRSGLKKQWWMALAGVICILVGWLMVDPYWGGVLSGLGTTLIGLCVYWLLQDVR
jgi:hypothetical protein